MVNKFVYENNVKWTTSKKNHECFVWHQVVFKPPFPLPLPHPKNCDFEMQNLVSENQKKSFRCPYFREEGGGLAAYQNVLIFYVLIRGRREGVLVD